MKDHGKGKAKARAKRAQKRASIEARKKKPSAKNPVKPKPEIEAREPIEPVSKGVPKPKNLPKDLEQDAEEKTASKKKVTKKKSSRKNPAAKSKKTVETKSQKKTVEPVVIAPVTLGPVQEAKDPPKNGKRSRSNIQRYLEEKKRKRQERNASKAKKSPVPPQTPGAAPGQMMAYAIPLDPVFVRDLDSDQFETDGVPWIIGADGLPQGIVLPDSAIVAYRPTPIHLAPGARALTFCCEYASIESEDTFSEPACAFEMSFLDKEGRARVMKTDPISIKGFDVYEFRVPLQLINALQLLRCSLKIIPMSGHPIMLVGSWMRLYM